jgi:LysM repeat protein
MFDPLRHFRFLIFAFLALALSLTAACERRPGFSTSVKDVPESTDPLFTEARERRRKGDLDIALNQFLDLIHARDDGAPESHLEVAAIYLNKNRPAVAIYHLEEYQRLRPSSERTRQVKDQIQLAERMLITKRIPGFTNEDKRMHDELNALGQRYKLLSRDNDQLKKTNMALQAQIAALKKVAAATPLPPGGPPPAPPQRLPLVAISPSVPPPAQPGVKVGVPTSYTVKKGDTLSRISAKIYGTSARWRDIHNANRDKMPREDTSLQQGWVLKIPPP